MSDKRLLVPVELMQRIGAYLVQRPYAEVAQIIADVSAQVRPHEPPPAPETPA